MLGAVIAVLVFVVRVALVVALVLSAGWKLRHRGEFRLVVRRLARPAVARFHALVPAVELLLACFLLFPGLSGRVAAVTAAAMLVVFSMALRGSRGGQGGCGCWSEASTPIDPEAQSRLLIARNGALVAFALIAAVAPGGLPAASGLAVAVACGSLLALIVLEIPQIGAVATFERSGGRLEAPSR